MSDLLILIPARGGSRGIPRKVLQPVAGVPLLVRTIRTAQESGVATRIVVSTEDAGIAAVARLHGAEVLERPAELAGDEATIGDVVDHALDALSWDGRVLVMQPTCPLVTGKSVRHWLHYVEELGLCWAISGSREGHLLWHNGRLLTDRVNRQQSTVYGGLVRESGALQFFAAGANDAFAYGSARGQCVLLPDEHEALDIDTHADLRAAELALSRRSIGFRVAVGTQVGTGHFWRCLQLSDALSFHHLTWWFVGEPEKWQTDLLDARGIDCRGWDITAGPELVVVDALDAAETIVPHAKAYGAKTVVFEYDGWATKFADVVIDEFADPRYAVLRPEFLALPERDDQWYAHRLRDRPRMLVSFGGTDPSGLARRFAPLLNFGQVRVVQGPGAAPLEWSGGAEVVRDASMAEEMRWADVVVTSQGRTVTEAAACGVPVVSIAANERESRHVRIPGVLYLGLHALVGDEHVRETVMRLLDSPGLRAEMARTARAQVDGKGVRRIVRRIEDLLEDL